ncbi:hypothetical protein ACQJBY_012747 [Aegilops geniculata]
MPEGAGGEARAAAREAEVLRALGPAAAALAGLPSSWSSWSAARSSSSGCKQQHHGPRPPRHARRAPAHPLAAEPQAALQRRGGNRLAFVVRSLRRAEKDLTHLSASVHAMVKFPVPSASNSAAGVEVSGVLAKAVATTVFRPSKPCPSLPPPKRPLQHPPA